MVGMLSDIGNIREVNEDYLGCYEDTEKKIYIVADGVGGHNAGEVASKLAVDTIINYINSIYCIEDQSNVLKEAIEFSNKKVFEASKADGSLNGMGTTITCCFLKDDKIVVGNVGDSRCYIIKDQNIYQVTKDHSLVQQLVDDGSITQEEAQVHPNKNIITRALGTASNVEVDIYTLNLKNINKVILCTDGLSDFITQDEMFDIVINNDVTTACKKLIDLSKQRSGRDNISVIIFEGECKDDRDFTR